MSGERAPECFQALLKLLDSTSKILAPWSMRLDSVIAMSDPKDIKIRCDDVLSSFPVESWGFANGIVWSDPERIRIWMVCNINESMAKELQLRIDRCGRSFILLGRIKQTFSAMDPDKRDEPRMARIMAKCCERCFSSFLGLETFIGDLCAAMGWKRGNGASGDGKPLAQQFETKDEAIRPDDGFSEDGRTFRWCGESYSLRESASKVVKVLYDAYMRGTQFMHEQYIKEESEVNSDVRTIVRDNKLAKLIIPEVDSDGKRVKGKWGLMPRTK